MRQLKIETEREKAIAGVEKLALRVLAEDVEEDGRPAYSKETLNRRTE